MLLKLLHNYIEVIHKKMINKIESAPLEGIFPLK